MKNGNAGDGDWSGLIEKYVTNTYSAEELEQILRIAKDRPDELFESLKLQWAKAEGMPMDFDKDRIYTSMMQNVRVVEQVPSDGEEEKKEYQVIKTGIKGKVNTLRPASLRRMWVGIAAASILFILATGGYFLLFKNESISNQDRSIARSSDVEAPKGVKAMITLADGRVIALDSLNSGILALEGGVSVVKTETGAIQYLGKATELAYNTLSNPRGGGVVTLALSDGTQVWLNSESSLRYPVAFSGATREVEITGEAYFEVAKDKVKKFIVKGSGITTEVLGTHFNINTYKDGEALKVTLLEGKVKTISRDGASATLKPGQQAQIDASGRIALNDDVDLTAVMAWKNGFFSFEGTHIKELMKEISRWYDVEVVFQAVPQETFTGKIDRNLSLASVLKGLADTRVNYRIENGKRLIILP